MTLRFQADDFLPPVFDDAYYAAALDDPGLAGADLPFALPVSPSNIRAADGDGLGVDIEYELESGLGDGQDDCESELLVEIKFFRTPLLQL